MYEQLCLWEPEDPYIPKVDDYVILDRGKYGKDEGWVYFCCEAYITIETSVKPRPNCEYSTKPPKHRNIHTLLLCHAPSWKELQYVKTRKQSSPSK